MAAIRRRAPWGARYETDGIDILAYYKRSGRYRINLVPGDVEKHRDTIKELLKRAYDE